MSLTGRRVIPDRSAMPYVNELISTEDRLRYQLEDFDERFPSASPSDDWAIDRSEPSFLRLMQCFMRTAVEGPPEMLFEKDFHFHWQGYDFLVSTREVAQRELAAWPGQLLEQVLPTRHHGRGYAFFLRHIGEIRKPRGMAVSALKHQRLPVLAALQEALAISCGGVCTRASDEALRAERFGLIKLGPHAIARL